MNVNRMAVDIQHVFVSVSHDYIVRIRFPQRVRMLVVVREKMVVHKSAKWFSRLWMKWNALRLMHHSTKTLMRSLHTSNGKLMITGR